jgi:hypothetical protein
MFDNLWLVTNTLSKATIASQGIYNTDTILVSQPHNSKLTKNSCRIYNNRYDYGLATTQQQVLQQETSAGFTTQMQFWSCNHTTASPSTRNFCRIYHRCNYGLATTQQQAHKELLQDLSQQRFNKSIKFYPSSH